MQSQEKYVQYEAVKVTTPQNHKRQPWSQIAAPVLGDSTGASSLGLAHVVTCSNKMNVGHSCSLKSTVTACERTLHF
jgi:hypothetical protein